MNKKSIILLLIIIIAVIIVGFNLHNLNKTTFSTTLSQKNNKSSFITGEKFSLTLKDENGKILVGKTLNINLTNDEKEIKSYSVKTNKKGFASIKLKESGNYSVNSIFDGDKNYKKSNLTSLITVNNRFTARLPSDKIKKEFQITLEGFNPHDKVSEYEPEDKKVFYNNGCFVSSDCDGKILNYGISDFYEL